jgi:hypothetical protein
MLGSPTARDNMSNKYQGANEVCSATVNGASLVSGSLRISFVSFSDWSNGVLDGMRLVSRGLVDCVCIFFGRWGYLAYFGWQIQK